MVSADQYWTNVQSKPRAIVNSRVDIAERAEKQKKFDEHNMRWYNGPPPEGGSNAEKLRARFWHPSKRKNARAIPKCHRCYTARNPWLTKDKILTGLEGEDTLPCGHTYRLAFVEEFFAQRDRLPKTEEVTIHQRERFAHVIWAGMALGDGHEENLFSKRKQKGFRLICTMMDSYGGDDMFKYKKTGK